MSSVPVMREKTEAETGVYVPHASEQFLERGLVSRVKTATAHSWLVKLVKRRPRKRNHGVASLYLLSDICVRRRDARLPEAEGTGPENLIDVAGDCVELNANSMN